MRGPLYEMRIRHIDVGTGNPQVNILLESSAYFEIFGKIHELG